MQLNKNKKKIPLIVKIFDPRMFFYDLVKWTGALSVVIFFRQKRHYINGKKQKGLFKGSSIIVANHTSFLDPLVIANAFWCKRAGFLATSALFKNKFRRILFTGFGCIEVNKENVSVSTFKKTTKMLNRGHSLIVFPEGQVIRDGDISRFKSGAILMALFANVPIIPAYVVKRENWWHRQHIIIGEKFYVSDYIKSPIPSMEEIEEVTRILHDKEAELEKIGKKEK